MNERNFLLQIIFFGFLTEALGANCFFDFEIEAEIDDFEVNCDGTKNVWDIKDIPPDLSPPEGTKALTTQEQQKGCVKSKKQIQFDDAPEIEIFLYAKYIASFGNVNFEVTLLGDSGEDSWDIAEEFDIDALLSGAWLKQTHKFDLIKLGNGPYKLQMTLYRNSASVLIDNIKLLNVQGGSDQCYEVSRPPESTTVTSTESTTITSTESTTITSTESTTITSTESTTITSTESTIPSTESTIPSTESTTIPSTESTTITSTESTTVTSTESTTETSTSSTDTSTGSSASSETSTGSTSSSETSTGSTASSETSTESISSTDTTTEYSTTGSTPIEESSSNFTPSHTTVIYSLSTSPPDDYDLPNWIPIVAVILVLLVVFLCSGYLFLKRYRRRRPTDEVFLYLPHMD